VTSRLLLLTGTLLLAVTFIHVTAVREAVPLRRPLAELPPTIGAWRSVGDAPLDRGTLDVLRADDYLNRTYARGMMSADLFVAYYATQRQGDTMHSPMNCLPAAGWQALSTGRLQVDMGSAAPIEVNRYVIQKGLDQRLVLYWYQTHGRTIASEYASKAYLVLDSLRLHRSDAALVRVIAPLAHGAVQMDQATGFVQALYPVLAGYIPT
jgi:EpsI family protein